LDYNLNMDTVQRQTKYCQLIRSELEVLGHATNAELLLILRNLFPKLSATTVHRATTRLASRGIISIAPPDNHNSLRYDFNTVPHDHFQCISCGLLRDADIMGKIIPILQDSIDGCSISGRLIINGTCKKCTENKGVNNENNNL